MYRDTGHRMKRRRLANCIYTLTRTPLQRQRGLPIFTAAHFPTSDFLREYIAIEKHEINVHCQLCLTLMRTTLEGQRGELSNQQGFFVNNPLECQRDYQRYLFRTIIAIGSERARVLSFVVVAHSI